MSFLSKLFGGGGGGENSAAASTGPEEEYNGYIIRAVSMSAGSEFQLAGSIEKTVAGEVKKHEFVRADRFPSRSDAASATLAKGRQIIDEQGDRMFSQTWPRKSS